jgi:hypothetical protein
MYTPVCGCDGKIYPNACTANMANVDTSVDAPCAAPSGYFRCGAQFCVLGMEFCEVLGMDGPSNPSFFATSSPAPAGPPRAVPA